MGRGIVTHLFNTSRWNPQMLARRSALGRSQRLWSRSRIIRGRLRRPRNSGVTVAEGQSGTLSRDGAVLGSFAQNIRLPVRRRGYRVMLLGG